MGVMIELIKQRKLIYKLAKNDFKSRYAGSFLGITWAFVQPCVTTIIYAFIFGSGLKTMSVGDSYPFLLYLIAGIIPWFFFNDALNSATNSIVEYSYIIKKVIFNINLLPIIKIVSASFVHLFFIGLGIVVFLLHGEIPPIQLIQVIYYSFATLVLALGLSYLTSAIVVFFKDMSQIVNIMLQFSLWLTPIMYDLSIFPSWVGTILKLNPLYYVVTGYRDCFIYGKWFFERGYINLYFWGVTILIYLVGTHIFNKQKTFFADVL